MSVTENQLSQLFVYSQLRTKVSATSIQVVLQALRTVMKRMRQTR